MSLDQDISRLAKKFALLNAIEHKGTANPSSVVGRILAEKSHLRRYAQKVKGIVSEAVAEVNEMSEIEQEALFKSAFPGELEARFATKKQLSKTESEKPIELPDLPDARQGFVVTRFPPEPIGFMHIGHAMAAIIG